MRIRSLILTGLTGCTAVVALACRSTDSDDDFTSPGSIEVEGGVRAIETPAELAKVAREAVARGDELLAEGDLRGALAEYSSALEIMPENEAARSGVVRVQDMLRDELAQAEPIVDEAESVRRAQARAVAQRHVADAERFMQEERYEDAAQSYRRAQAVLRFQPTLATGELAPEVLAERLALAERSAEEQAAAEQELARQRAREERASRERAQAEYRANRLRTLYAQANAHFQREQYGQAEALAEQILLHDPGNETAMELRDIAAAARHRQATAETRRKYRENWIRTFEELQGLSVPQTDTLVFNDLERWKEVSQRRPYEFSASQEAANESKEAVLQRLEELRVPARFGEDGDGAPLEEIASYLQNVTGVNFLVSPRVTDELDEDETSVYLDLPDRNVRQLLDIITEIRENLRWKIEDGVVKFVTSDELVGGQSLRMYEVRDLIRPVKDFPGREINVSPSDGLPELDEDLEEREAQVITEDSLDALIRDNVATASWDEDPANSLRISNGTLVVNQTPEVHAQIQALLDDLREATGIMVDIEARFLKVEDNFLEDIGVDFRGLGSPGLGTNEFFNDFGDPTAQSTLGQDLGTGTDPGAFFDDGGDADVLARVENLYDGFLGDEDVLTGTGGLSFQWTYLNELQFNMVLRAVAKSERVELVTAPRLLVFNTARSNLTVMNQVAYVQDYEVELAQGASIADPVISVVEDGVILDVRPVVSADRRFITLELRPTVAELVRPISTFTTTLGVSTNTITIQLPELEVSRVRTSIPMPDGGTVLLGGFKVHDSQDYRSGVPILNRIPLVSFLFERQGTFVSNRKLLILLKARIVIPEEHEPSPAQLGMDANLALAPN